MGNLMRPSPSQTTLDISAEYSGEMAACQRVGDRGPGGEPGQDRPGVAGAVDQRVDGVAVGGDGRPADDAVLVLVVGGLLDPAGASCGGGVLGGGGVGHAQGDVADPVAVAGDVLGDLGAGAKRAGQQQPDRPLLEHPGGVVAQAGLGAGVGDRGEAEPGAVEVGRLLGVADPQLDMVDAEQGEGVVWGSRGHAPPPRDGKSSPECAKGRDEVPAPRPIYRLDAAYARTGGWLVGSASVVTAACYPWRSTDR